MQSCSAAGSGAGFNGTSGEAASGEPGGEAATGE